MNYVYRFRLYPTKEQEQFLKQEAGNIRFVYNYFLSLAKREYETNNKKWNYYEYKKLLPKLKKEFEFLKLSNSQSLQESLKNLDKAFKNFFKGLSDFPKFKKKKKTNSISIPQHFRIEDNKLKIPKLKTYIKFKKHRKIEGEIKSISITITPSGKYYLNVLTNRNITPLPKTDKVIAIDMGLTDFIVTSDNQAIKNPKHFKKLERRLKLWQRRLSRKEKGSNNFKKWAKRVAKLHEKITNAKNDFLHKLSKRLIDENQVIIVENLNIKGLIKNKKLSKHIHQASWYKFINMLEYKAKFYGRELIKVNTFYPSSKLCSVCGYKNKELKLSDRIWTCPVCKTIHNRDYNATINLLKEGLKQVGLERPELMPVEVALTAERS
ncbi:MAG: IS200/IS605 family element transposase accessory protein TnpB [Epsilonproteobacteria bacterium]|nr:IS200/IS605 family element transposase accessory protein TnpB [Campylobacterota bacterium]